MAGWVSRDPAPGHHECESQELGDLLPTVTDPRVCLPIRPARRSQ